MPANQQPNIYVLVAIFYQPPVNVASNQDLVMFLVGQKMNSKGQTSCDMQIKSCKVYIYIHGMYMNETHEYIIHVYVKSVRLHNINRHVRHVNKNHTFGRFRSILTYLDN